MAGELLIGAVDDVVALRPAAHRGEVDIDHGADEIAAGADRDRLADVGIEFELVLDVFGREQRAVLEPADILGAVDDLQVPGLGVEEAGVAGMHPAVRRAHLGGLFRILVVADEDAGRAEQHFAGLGNLDLDVGRGFAHGLGVDLAVRLRGDIDRGFGLAVELFQIDAERAIEAEDFRADRFAGGIADANAREPEAVLKRAVDEEIRRAR